MSSGNGQPLLGRRREREKRPDRRPLEDGRRLFGEVLRARKGLGRGLRRPKLSIQLWLTALFLMVTAFAGVTAYSIVYPYLSDTLEQSSRAAFDQIKDGFEQRLEGNPSISLQNIETFANSRDVEWGIVQREGGQVLEGDLTDYDPAVVREALRVRKPVRDLAPVQSGDRQGQERGTYAAPIMVSDEMRDDLGLRRGETDTAIVFTKYYTESDIENTSESLRSINNLALLALALALLIAGFTGYVVANLISRRLSRLDVAARRLAAGGFDERIKTRVQDEVGSLGETFNSMAASLKGAFRQLEQEKARGGAILDGMTDAVVGVDADLNVTFQNPKARELLEGSGPEFHEKLQQVLAKSRFSGPVTEPEAEAEGGRIMEIRAAPLEGGALAIMRDVTEERRIERSKAEFIANASHELKTPLFALSGNLDLLEDEEDEEMRQEFLDQMRAATTRLESLAKILLELSRIDANAMTFRLEEVDLEEMLHDLRRDFAYTGREIRVHAEEGVPPVLTDPVQIYRVFTILLDNALKYSGGPNGDTPVNLDLRREGGHALVSVADRGCGIPEGELRHVFERFYRAQGSSRADGTGLGLALAWEIAQHLGGDIIVESEPNVGSTFTVELPLSDTRPTEPAAATAAYGN
jgi:two-component system sensor histidine kinase ResE